MKHRLVFLTALLCVFLSIFTPMSALAATEASPADSSVQVTATEADSANVVQLSSSAPAEDSQQADTDDGSQVNDASKPTMSSYTQFPMLVLGGFCLAGFAVGIGMIIYAVKKMRS